MRYFILILSLAACTASEPTLPPPGTDTCNANEYSALIGQDATALERVMLLGMVRVIKPDSIVTKDYRLERINFYVDETNAISAIKCG